MYTTYSANNPQEEGMQVEGAVRKSVACQLSKILRQKGYFFIIRDIKPTIERVGDREVSRSYHYYDINIDWRINQTKRSPNPYFPDPFKYDVLSEQLDRLSPTYPPATEIEPQLPRSEFKGNDPVVGILIVDPDTKRQDLYEVLGNLNLDRNTSCSWF